MLESGGGFFVVAEVFFGDDGEDLVAILWRYKRSQPRNHYSQLGDFIALSVQICAGVVELRAESGPHICHQAFVI